MIVPGYPIEGAEELIKGVGLKIPFNIRALEEGTDVVDDGMHVPLVEVIVAGGIRGGGAELVTVLVD